MKAQTDVNIGDRTGIKAAAGGEPDCRGYFQRYAGDLMSFAAGMLGNRADAEDACQETFLRIFRSWAGFDPAGDFKGLAFTVCYRYCLDMIRKRRRFAGFVGRASALAGAGRSAADSAHERLLASEALAALKPSERACLLLWARDGYTSRETAGILGCSPATVRVRLFQARKKIKARLEKHNERKTAVPYL